MIPVLFTDKARQDFCEIEDYIAKDNPLAADAFTNRLEKRCMDLGDNPRIGRNRDELVPSMRSVTEGEYVIFYRPKVEQIEILRIIQGNRDIQSVFTDEVQ